MTEEAMRVARGLTAEERDARELLCAQAICDSEIGLTWEFLEGRCAAPFSDDRYRSMRDDYIRRARYVLAFLDGGQAGLSVASKKMEE